MRIALQLLEKSDDYAKCTRLSSGLPNGLFMSFGSAFLRRITACLAILISPMGSLQQSRAFCYWTDCSCASGQVDAFTADQRCHDPSDHEHESAIERTPQQLSLERHHNLPCQQGCWCCRPTDPVKIPSDETDGAKRLLASLSLISVDTMIGAVAEHIATPFDDGAPRDADTLSAAQFCVQLCRFRI
jgi:hypothetical protein